MANVGFDSTAIAWALAHNTEQEQAFTEKQKQFRKDVKDSFDKTKEALEKAGWKPDPGSEDPTTTLEEEYDHTIPSGEDINFDIDENGNASGDHVFDFKKGTNLISEYNKETYILNMSLDYSAVAYYPRSWTYQNDVLEYKGAIKIVATKSTGELVFRQWFYDLEYWAWGYGMYDPSTYRRRNRVVGIKISPSKGDIIITGVNEDTGSYYETSDITVRYMWNAYTDLDYYPGGTSGGNPAIDVLLRHVNRITNLDSE